MTRFKLALCVLASASAMSACSDPQASADVEASLRAATASAIMETDVHAIEVLNPQRSAAKWTWQAKAGDRVYDCDSDDKMRLPSCRQTS